MGLNTKVEHMIFARWAKCVGELAKEFSFVTWDWINFTPESVSTGCIIAMCIICVKYKKLEPMNTIENMTCIWMLKLK